MSHRYHPDIEDPYNDSEEAILFDECEDCEARAQYLGTTLDVNNWWRMWNRMLAVEIDQTEAYRSINEAKLGSQLYHMYILLERQTAVDPKFLIHART